METRVIWAAQALLLLGCKAHPAPPPPVHVGSVGPEPWAPPLVLTGAEAGTYLRNCDGGIPCWTTAAQTPGRAITAVTGTAPVTASTNDAGAVTVGVPNGTEYSVETARDGGVGLGPVNLASSAAVTGVLPAGNQAAQTMGGDISGTTAAATVTNAQGGTLGFGSATGTITGSAAATAVGMAQTTPGSVAIPNNMTFTTQAPNGGSGSAAQNTPGSFVVNLPVVGTVGTIGASPYLTTEYGGTPVVWQGPFAGFGAGAGAIYFAGNNPSTAVLNYGFLGGSTYTILNAPSGGTLYFGIGSPGAFTPEIMTTSGIQMLNGETADLGGGAGVLGIGAAATAPTGATATAGNVVLYSTTAGLYVDGHSNDRDRLSAVTSGTHSSQVLQFGAGPRQQGTTTQAGSVVLTIPIPTNSACMLDLEYMSWVTSTSGGTVAGLTVGDVSGGAIIGAEVQNTAGTAGLPTNGTVAATGPFYSTSQVGNSCAVTVSGANIIFTCTALSTNGVLKWTVEAQRQDCN